MQFSRDLDFAYALRNRVLLQMCGRDRDASPHQLQLDLLRPKRLWSAIDRHTLLHWHHRPDRPHPHSLGVALTIRRQLRLRSPFLPGAIRQTGTQRDPLTRPQTRRANRRALVDQHPIRRDRQSLRPQAEPQAEKPQRARKNHPKTRNKPRRIASLDSFSYQVLSLHRDTAMHPPPAALSLFGTIATART